MSQYSYGAKAYAPSPQAISNGHMLLRSQGTCERNSIKFAINTSCFCAGILIK